MFQSAGSSAGVAHEGGQFSDEGTQTVRWRALLGDVGVDFHKRRAGALSRRHRIALELGGLILVGEQQWPPGLDHVPLDVIAQHAQEDMRTHSALESVMDRADLQVHGFQGTERTLDLGERLVTAHGLGRRDLFFG